MWQGGYSAYTVARELELVRQQQVYTTQQKEIARMEAAMNQFQQWANNTLDRRFKIRARNMQRRIDRIDQVERPVLRAPQDGAGAAQRARAAASASSRCATASSTPC